MFFICIVLQKVCKLAAPNNNKMKFHIDKTEKITAEEALFVVTQIVNRLFNARNLDEAYEIVDKYIDDKVFWQCGRGGWHIWVTKNNERLIVITE